MPPATMISQKLDVSCETEAEMMGAKVLDLQVRTLAGSALWDECTEKKPSHTRCVDTTEI